MQKGDRLEFARKTFEPGICMLYRSAVLFFVIIWGLTPNLNADCWEEFVPRAVNENPGTPNPHANSSGHRIARIDGATVILAPHGDRDYTYRSIDNGLTWDLIDTDGTYSSTLISGPDHHFYHFYRTSETVEMVKFAHDEAPAPPVTIYSNSDIWRTDTGVYRSIDATVDQDGNLFVALHWGNPDHVRVMSSSDAGNSWKGPFQVSPGETHSWYYPRLTVTMDNTLVCSYDNFSGASPHTIVLGISNDNGQTWTNNIVSVENTANPSPLIRGNEEIFIFAQSRELARTGLVFNHSPNLGKSWDGWTLIDETCGYGDPSAALGADGHKIYVAYRSSNGTGVTQGTCGDQSRFRLAMTTDSGATWDFPDNHYAAARTGTRNHLRYQTWFNYGGPLEWVWMQYENEDSENEVRKTYYDRCLDEFIYSVQTSEHSGGGGGGCVIRIASEASNE